MKLDELGETLCQAISSGKVGTAVSLRTHVQLSEGESDLIGVFSLLLKLAGSAFGAEASTLFARQNADERQLNVLARYPDGQTAMFTVGCGSVTCSQCQLLLVGNHGIARLEGGEYFEETLPEMPADVERIRTLVDKSVAQRAPVAMSKA